MIEFDKDINEESFVNKTKDSLKIISLKNLFEDKLSLLNESDNIHKSINVINENQIISNIVDYLEYFIWNLGINESYEITVKKGRIAKMIELSIIHSNNDTILCDIFNVETQSIQEMMISIFQRYCYLSENILIPKEDLDSIIKKFL